MLEFWSTSFIAVGTIVQSVLTGTGTSTVTLAHTGQPSLIIQNHVMLYKNR